MVFGITSSAQPAAHRLVRLRIFALARPRRSATSATGFLVDNIYLAVIPEPSSLALSLLGGFGLLAMFRRRR